MLLLISALLISQTIVKLMNFYFKFTFIYNHLTFEEKKNYFQLKLYNKIPSKFIEIINPKIQNILIFIMFFIYSFTHYLNITDNDIDIANIEKYTDELIEEQFQEDIDKNLLILKKEISTKRIDNNEFIHKNITKNNLELLNNIFINNIEITSNINEELPEDNNIDEFLNDVITRDSNEYVLVDDKLKHNMEFLNKDEINLNEINFGDTLSNISDTNIELNIVKEIEHNIVKEIDIKKEIDIEQEKVNINNNIQNNNENSNNENSNNENIKIIRIVKKKK